MIIMSLLSSSQLPLIPISHPTPTPPSDHYATTVVTTTTMLLLSSSQLPPISLFSASRGKNTNRDLRLHRLSCAFLGFFFFFSFCVQSLICSLIVVR
ncbi:hypothetical protein L6452_38289 [Arctium lappa]|uniref:Uncharacterized protein n=1 Tax=Arctium lappa TaxID=4217 RepID=A0ACB8Y5B5_ARCLA|nr:hypothetical protein L6452_38289 [Arctium lappa]